MRLLYSVALVLVFTLAFGAKTETRYVPLKCISRLVIHDFGVCKPTGGQMDCPTAHLSFTVGCESAKPESSTPQQMNIVRPGAVVIDNPTTKENQ